MDDILNLKFDLARNKIISNSPPSLQQVATVQIGVKLWHAEVIKIFNFYEHQRMVQDNLSLLIMPKSLKDKVAQILELIGEQLFRLCRSMEKIFEFRARWLLLRSRICWTSQCTIDKQSTAKNFADCEDLALETRFEIALEFCLETHIEALYRKFSRDYIKRVRDFAWHVPSLWVMESSSGIHVRFPLKLMHYYQFHFYIWRFGNSDIVRFIFWEKLAAYEKREIVNALSNFYCGCPEIVLFLFTLLNTEQKLDYLQNRKLAFNLLKALLDLIWFPDFVDCIREMTSFLDANSKLLLLHSCIRVNLWFKLTYKNKYADICEMLVQQLLLDNCKSAAFRLFHSFDCQILKNIVITLLKTEEFSLLKTFLKLMRIEDREKYVTDDEFLNYVFSLIKEKNFSYLDRIFSLFFSDFGRTESCKMQFFKKSGLYLCQKLVRDDKLEFVREFIKFIFASEDEANSFYSEIMVSIEYHNTEPNCL